MRKKEENMKNFIPGFSLGRILVITILLAHFALAQQDISININTSSDIATPGLPVSIEASVYINGIIVLFAPIDIILLHPDGVQEKLELGESVGGYRTAEFTPELEGTYTIVSEMDISGAHHSSQVSIISKNSNASARIELEPIKYPSNVLNISLFLPGLEGESDVRIFASEPGSDPHNICDITCGLECHFTCPALSPNRSIHQLITAETTIGNQEVSATASYEFDDLAIGKQQFIFGVSGPFLAFTPSYFSLSVEGGFEGSLGVEMRLPNGSMKSLDPASVIPLADGSFNISFFSEEEGYHEITAFLKNPKGEIIGVSSPFGISIDLPPDIIIAEERASRILYDPQLEKIWLDLEFDDISDASDIKLKVEGLNKKYLDTSSIFAVMDHSLVHLNYDDDSGLITVPGNIHSQVLELLIGASEDIDFRGKTFNSSAREVTTKIDKYDDYLKMSVESGVYSDYLISFSFDDGKYPSYVTSYDKHTTRDVSGWYVYNHTAFIFDGSGRSKDQYIMGFQPIARFRMTNLTENKILPSDLIIPLNSRILIHNGSNISVNILDSYGLLGKSYYESNSSFIIPEKSRLVKGDELGLITEGVIPDDAYLEFSTISFLMISNFSLSGEKEENSNFIPEEFIQGSFMIESVRGIGFLNKTIVSILDPNGNPILSSEPVACTILDNGSCRANFSLHIPKDTRSGQYTVSVTATGKTGYLASHKSFIRIFSQIPSVSIGNAYNVSGKAGSSVSLKHTIFNDNALKSDIIDIGLVSDFSSIHVFEDIDGRLFPLEDTNLDGIIDTGILLPKDSIDIVVVVDLDDPLILGLPYQLKITAYSQSSSATGSAIDYISLEEQEDIVPMNYDDIDVFSIGLKNGSLFVDIRNNDVEDKVLDIDIDATEFIFGTAVTHHKAFKDVNIGNEDTTRVWSNLSLSSEDILVSAAVSKDGSPFLDRYPENNQRTKLFTADWAEGYEYRARIPIKERYHTDQLNYTVRVNFDLDDDVDMAGMKILVPNLVDGSIEYSEIDYSLSSVDWETRSGYMIFVVDRIPANFGTEAYLYFNKGGMEQGLNVGSRLPEVIIDDTDPRVETHGIWHEDFRIPGYFRSGYLQDMYLGKGEKFVVYSPGLEKAGYEIYSFNPVDASFSENTMIQINHVGGIDNVVINQRVSKGWFYLGMYELDEDSRIIINNLDSRGVVVADAIKLIKISQYAGLGDVESLGGVNASGNIRPPRPDSAIIFGNNESYEFGSLTYLCEGHDDICQILNLTTNQSIFCEPNEHFNVTSGSLSSIIKPLMNWSGNSTLGLSLRFKDSLIRRNLSVEVIEVRAAQDSELNLTYMNLTNTTQNVTINITALTNTSINTTINTTVNITNTTNVTMNASNITLIMNASNASLNISDPMAIAAQYINSLPFEQGDSAVGKDVVWKKELVVVEGMDEEVPLEIPPEAGDIRVNKISESRFYIDNGTLGKREGTTSVNEKVEATLEIGNKKNISLDRFNMIKKVEKNISRLLHARDQKAAEIEKSNFLQKIPLMLEKREIEKKIGDLNSTYDLQMDEGIALRINQSGNFSMEYTTPAPTKLEFNISSVRGKRITGVKIRSNASVHYHNVSSFADIPESLPKNVRLYHYIEGRKINIVDDPRYRVKLLDTDMDGMIDRVEWITPMLSDQEFQIEIVSENLLNTSVGDIFFESTKGKIDYLSVDDALNINFSITNLTVGEKVNLSIYLPLQLPEGLDIYFWKPVGGSLKSIDYELIQNRTGITLFLQDGVIDDDGVADGKVTDPLNLFIPSFDVDVKRSPSSGNLTMTEDSKTKQISLSISDGTLEDLKIVDPSNTINTPSSPFEFKLLKYDIANLTSDSVDITITYSEPLPSGMKYKKFNPNTGSWIDYPYERIDDYTIMISIYDGGPGDSDGIKDGRISDPGGPTVNWWNINWLYRKNISFDYTSGTSDLTNYSMQIKINETRMGPDFNWTLDMNSSRYIWYNGSKFFELDYFIEDWNTTSKNASVWVKMPLIKAGNITDLTIYFGNRTEPSLSNGTNTFDFFDDFKGNSLDLTRWTNYTEGSQSVSGSVMSMWGGWNDNGYYINTQDTFTAGTQVGGRWRISTTTGDVDLSVGFVPASGTVWWANSGIYLLYDSNGGGAANRKEINILGTEYGANQIESADWQYFRTYYNYTSIHFWDSYDGWLNRTGDAGIISPYYLSIAADTDSAARFGYIDFIYVAKHVMDEPSIYYGEEPQIISPDLVSGILPANASTGASISPTLSATVYHPLGIDMNVTFHDASDDSVIGTDYNVSNSTTASTTWIGLTEATEYSWYMNISDRNGGWTRTPTYYFTTTQPGNIQLVSPNHLQSGVSVTPLLKVKVTDSDGDKSNVTFFDASTNTSIGVVENVISGTLAILKWNGLSINTEYSWFVNATDRNGVFNTSETWNFTTTSCGCPDDSGWWNTSFGYRNKVCVCDTYGDVLRNYSVEIDLSTINFNWSYLDSSGEDLRFSYYNESDGTQREVPYWIEDFNISINSSKIWVKAPYLPASDSATLYIYYNNSAVSTTSNGTRTFVMFDDFESYGSTADGNLPPNWMDFGSGDVRLLTNGTNRVLLKDNNNDPNGGNRSIGKEMTNWEARVLTLRDDQSGGARDRYSIGSTAANGYGVDMYGFTGTSRNFDLERRTGGTSVALPASSTFTGYEDTWYKVRLSRYNGSLETSMWEMDDTLVVAVADSDYMYNNSFTNFFVHGGHEYWSDNIFVREFVPSEPTYIIGVQEYAGHFNVTIDAPVEFNTIPNTIPFDFNGSVNCTSGSCGNTSVKAEYYASVTPLYTWKEHTTSDFITYNTSINVSIFNDSLTLSPVGSIYPWWNSAWEKRMELNLSGIQENITDYTVELVLNQTNIPAEFNFSYDNQSIRFVAYDQSSGDIDKLGYWIEYWNETEKRGIIWVQFPSLEQGKNLTFHMYYNNSAAKSESNGTLAFVFFDGFDQYTEPDNTIPSTWNDYGTGDVRLNTTAGNRVLNKETNSDPNGGLINIGTIISDYELILRTNRVYNSGSNANRYSVSDASGNGYGPYMNPFQAAGTLRIERRAGGTGTNIGSDTFDGALNNWYRVRFRRNGSFMNLSFGYLNGTMPFSVEAVDSTYSSFNTFFIHGGYIYQTDDIAIRKLMSDGIDPKIYFGSNQNLSYNPSGRYISGTYDTKASSVNYRNISWTVTNDNTSIKVYTRTSVNNASWSAWFLQNNNSDVYAPKREYIQYRVDLFAGLPVQSPIFKTNQISYEALTAGWVEVNATGTLFLTPDAEPVLCGILNESSGACGTNWTLTPTAVGNYSLRISANGSAGPGVLGEDNITVTIKANTSIFNFAPNQTTAARGSTIQLTAQLKDIDDSKLVGFNLSYYDQTDNHYIGSGLTDSNGYVTLDYAIPSGASLGDHTLNVTFLGSGHFFLYPSSDTTTLKISSFPIIKDIDAAPQTFGFDYNTTISCNASEDLSVGLDQVYAQVFLPDGTNATLPMSNTTFDIYHAVFNESWTAGIYSYRITANNTDGIITVSPTNYFYVSVDQSTEIRTDKDEYKNFEDVKLLYLKNDWWNSSWKYRIPLNITNTDKNLSRYQVKVDLDSMDTDISFNWSKEYDSARFTWKNQSGQQEELAFWIEGWDVSGETATIWVNLPLIEKDKITEIFMYYSNPDVTNASSGGGTFLLFDDFNDGSLNTTIWGFNGAGGYTESGGFMKIYGSDVVRESAITFPGDIEAKFTFKDSQSGGDFDSGLFLSQGRNENGYVLFWDLNPGNTADGLEEGWYSAPTSSMWASQNLDTTALQTAKFSKLATTYKGTWITQGETVSVTDATFNPTYVSMFADDDIGNVNNCIWFDWIFVRNFTSTEPVVSVGSPEQSSYTIRNKGETDFKGYLWIVVQEYNSGWQNIMPPVVNDLVPTPSERVLTAGNSLNLSQIWDANGGWNTDEYSPGNYRVSVLFQDNIGSLLYDSDGNPMSATYGFTIMKSVLSLSDLKHENQYEHSINEYEVGDNLSWINVTVQAKNNSAISANITLNIIDGGASGVDWGPDSNQLCGTISEGATCERMWDNSSKGYPIPLDAASGAYSFNWNVTMSTENGDTTINNTELFVIHNIPETFSSAFSPNRIFKPGFEAFYFGFNNTWSKNLTGATVSLICPDIIGLNCSCIGGVGGTCNLGQAGTLEASNVTFNVSVNMSTPDNNYNLNITLNYTNPGGELHSWSGEENAILEVRQSGLLDIVVFSIPKNMTRGAIYDFRIFANNTNTTADSDNVWLNYTLPQGMTNDTGVLKLFKLTLTAGKVLWNNITSDVSIGTKIGQNTIQMDSASDRGQKDIVLYDVFIYANTSIGAYLANDSTPDIGSSVRLSARLLFDNGTGVPGRTISFIDVTGNGTRKIIGNASTNASGHAVISYFLNPDVSLGLHELNATFFDSGYLHKSNTTTTIFIHETPKINNISTIPQNLGFGTNVTISLNATDKDDGIDSVLVIINSPDGEQKNYSLLNVTPDIYSLVFNDTWKLGKYNYSVIINDTIGSAVSSAVQFFTVNVSGWVNAETAFPSYKTNEYVNLTPQYAGFWFDKSWNYRRQFDVTENSGNDLIDFQYNLTFNSSLMIDEGKMNDNCSDLRFTDDSGNILSYWIEPGTCNTDNTTVWIKMNLPSSQSKTFFMFYGNPDAGANMSNGTDVFLLFDDFDDGLLDTTVWNFSGSGGYQEADGVMKITGSDQVKESKMIFNDNISVKARFRDSQLGGDFDSGIFFSEGRTLTGYVLFWDFSGTTSDGISENWYSSRDTWATQDMATTAWQTATWSREYQTYTGSWLEEADSVTLTDASNDPTHVSMFSDDDGTGFANCIWFDWIFVRNFTSQVPTSTGLGAEHELNSTITNVGAYDSYGYVVGVVQKKVAGSWQTIDTVINDSSVRRIANYSAFDLGTLWNSFSWFTSNNAAGEYKVYLRLADPYGAVLHSYIDTLNASALFNITAADVDVNLQDIRIYDVTGNPNPKFYTNDLVDSGLNSSFLLIKDHQYRVEIEMVNSGTDPWEISGAALNYTNFHENWSINPAVDIWYSNATDIDDRRTDTAYEQGNFTGGVIVWNTSMGGNLSAGENATFFFIFNSTNESERQVVLTLDDPNFFRKDLSVFSVVFLDTQAPMLFNNEYGLVSQNITRGTDNLSIYARWDTKIDSSNASYNSTSFLIKQYIVPLPGSNPMNWTNYSVKTSSLWYLGPHVAKLDAKDDQGNLNDSLPFLSFYLYGMAENSDDRISNTTIALGSQTLLSCRVTDATATSNPIQGYQVSFFNSTGLISVNTTNISGWAKTWYKSTNVGYEPLFCNISATGYYHINNNNRSDWTLRTIETVFPWSSDVGRNISGVLHKGDSLTLFANWSDNYALDYAWLYTNSTGSWGLESSMPISGKQDWANFSYTIPADMSPGQMGWRQYANDTSSNTNVTDIQPIEVWGWANLSEANLNPSAIYLNNFTTISCRVIDNANASGILGYNVSFYSNSSGYLGSNLTLGTGWASYTFQDVDLGAKNITCNITDDLMYNTTSDYTRKKFLSVVFSGDLYPPLLKNNVFGINDTLIYRGASILMEAWWNETLDLAYIEMNTTDTTFDIINLAKPYTKNWTNYTIETNNSWILGNHTLRLTANDTSGNINDTLVEMAFAIKAYSTVTWLQPTGILGRKKVNMTCVVNTTDSNIGVPGYYVYFYNSSNYLGFRQTVSSGEAKYEVDLTKYSLGDQEFTCTIFSQDWYTKKTGASSDSSTLTLAENPVVNLVDPSDNANLTPGQIFFFFNASHQDGIKNCTLFINSTKVNFSSSITSGKVENLSYSLLGIGGYNWNISCFDNSPQHYLGSSPERNLNIISPILNLSVVSIPSKFYLGASVSEVFLNISNNGNENASSVIVNLTLPVNWTFSPGNSSLINVGNLGVGETVNLSWWVEATFNASVGNQNLTFNATSDGNASDYLIFQTSAVSTDVEVLSLDAINDSCSFDNIQNITATIRNNGEEVEPFEAYLYVDGTKILTMNSSGNLSNGEKQNLSFQFKTGTNKSYQYTFEINLSIDTYDSNDRIKYQLTRFYPDLWLDVNVTQVSEARYGINLTAKNNRNCSILTNIYYFIPNSFNLLGSPAADETQAIASSYQGDAYRWNYTLQPLSSREVYITVDSALGYYRISELYMGAVSR